MLATTRALATVIVHLFIILVTLAAHWSIIISLHRNLTTILIGGALILIFGKKTSRVGLGEASK